MKKLLLTGSSGFIGGYFISKYRNRYEIKTFSFLRDDLDSLDCSGVDVVVHLSALVHQMGGATATEYGKVNVTQTLNLAKKAKEAGVGQFVFMSSVKVYGEESESVYDEESVCNPQDEYGKSKLRAEIELQKLEDENFKVTIIRTPIVYGYGVGANIKSLIKLVAKLPVLPFGKIENRRSMVYVGNLCHLVDEVIRQEKNGIFLASDDKPLSTSNLIKFIAKNLDKKVYLIKIPFFEVLLKFLKPSFYKRLYGSLEIENSATKNILKFKNPYSIEDGIKHMIKGEF